MTVDFSFKSAPSYRVATVEWSGTWNDRSIRSHFEELDRSAREAGIRTGKWIFRELDDNRFQACIEVKGEARSNGKFHVRTLPAVEVASVVFDPDEVSSRVVYHGLNDWLRWRKKDGEVRSVSSAREVYGGNPWKDKNAWARTEVQFIVRK
jgi:effector-binding domain-containing protein